MRALGEACEAAVACVSILRVYVCPKPGPRAVEPEGGGDSSIQFFDLGMIAVEERGARLGAGRSLTPRNLRESIRRSIS